MTPLLTERRRAEDFARAVDEGVPPRHRSLGEPVRLVKLLRSSELVELDPGFVSELRTQLIAAAHEELRSLVATGGPVGRKVTTTAPRKRLAAAASALVVVGGTVGVAAASQQAVPGDMLYPVKRTIEGGELFLAQSDSARGHELLEQAATRLQEVEVLVARGPQDPDQPEEIAAALDDFSAQAVDGGQLLLAVYQSEGDQAALYDVRVFAADSASSLTESAPFLPESAEDSLLEAVRAVQMLDSTAASVCPDCTSALPPVELGSVLTLPELSDLLPLSLLELPDLLSYLPAGEGAGILDGPPAPGALVTANLPGSVGLPSTIGPSAVGSVGAGAGPTPDGANGPVTTLPTSDGPGPSVQPTVNEPTGPQATGPQPTGPVPTGPATPTVTAPNPPTTTAPTVPTVTAPTVTTPSVPTPTVTVPTVTTPTVSTPTITVPTITVPSITEPSVTVPTVTLPAPGN